MWEKFQWKNIQLRNESQIEDFKLLYSVLDEKININLKVKKFETLSASQVCGRSDVKNVPLWISLVPKVLQIETTDKKFCMKIAW